MEEAEGSLDKTDLDPTTLTNSAAPTRLACINHGGSNKKKEP